MSTRQLTRSTTDVRFAGVCGGIAEYLEIDPTLVRLAFVVLTLWLGIVPGCVAYLLMMVLLPEGPAVSTSRPEVG